MDKKYKDANTIQEILRRTKSLSAGLRPHDGRLLDESGREVILNGINFVCKDKKLGYVHSCDRSLFAKLRQDGINVLRMGLIWDGVEPEPGVYNDAYLEKIHQQIVWAGEEGIRVFLDMHQDLYGVRYGDGAPDWATLSQEPHIRTEHWSDAYLESPAVMASFDLFWENAPVTGTKGVQDYFAEMWAYVAAFFADCPNLFGYDFLNEPYPGANGRQIVDGMLAAAAGLLPPDALKGSADSDSTELIAPGPSERMKAAESLWAHPKRRWQLLSYLNDPQIYRAVTEAAKPWNQAFEKEKLLPMYERVRKAAAEKCPEAAENCILLETSYFCNMAVESGVERLSPQNGMETRQIYAPHAYDFVVDTDAYDQYSAGRIQFILETHRKVQKRLALPMILGEWGAFPHKDLTYALAADILQTIEKYLWSQTYWCWYDGVEKGPYWNALRRAYPMAVAGRLLSYHWDIAAEEFTMNLLPEAGETVLFHPHLRGLQIRDVDFEGEGTVSFQLRPGEESGLIVMEFADSRERRVTVKKPR